ncbi:S1C family serine protease [Variovorax sp. RT4R15]|uniref:S1C family serine protease n=1 Tax=Variovorax sp. RT4R15 TaxID=3443737 RepID=UPI003F486586
MKASNLHLLLLSGCAVFASGAQALEPDVLFGRIAPSVWSVRTFDAQERPLRTGSAVVVAPGRLVTACHVLAKASSFVIRQDNVTYGATLEHPDPARDLCQIKVANFTAPPVAIAPAGAARVGQRVYAIGNPRGLENTLSEGILTGLRGGDDAQVPLLQTTAAVSQGGSGGGLFDQDGRLLGITSAAAPDDGNGGVAIPAAFVAELPVRAQTALATRSSEPAARPAALTLSSPLRTGDALEYVRTDRLTGNRTPVIYRVDRISGDELSFNAGGRIEKTDGRVVSVVTPVGGMYDTASPPGGWARKDVRPGMRWHLDYVATAGDKRRHEVDAVASGEHSVRIDGSEVRVLRISYEGWIYGTNYGTTTSQFIATVWYAAELGRVVRFEGRNSSRVNATDETLELVRVMR